MTVDWEAKAEQLLNDPSWQTDPVGWARRWAALAEAAGWPCYQMTWREWLADVQAQFAPDGQRFSQGRADGRRVEATQSTLRGMPARWR